uniref:Uncharacterized protein n=1 Tax=Arundo donax TaxID=35708 RepID=A0A0A9ERG6_ARUDO
MGRGSFGYTGPEHWDACLRSLLCQGTTTAFLIRMDVSQVLTTSARSSMHC